MGGRNRQIKFDSTLFIQHLSQSNLSLRCFTESQHPIKHKSITADPGTHTTETPVTGYMNANSSCILKWEYHFSKETVLW